MTAIVCDHDRILEDAFMLTKGAIAVLEMMGRPAPTDDELRLRLAKQFLRQHRCGEISEVDWSPRSAR